MRYCHVVDGKILEGPRALPKNWNNISNLDCLSDEELFKLGWIPHRFVETATPGQIILGSETIIYENEVVETQLSRDLNHVEIENRNQQLWKMIRNKRNYILSKCDYTQLNDCKLSAEKKEEWAVFRQTLRDLPNTRNDPNNITFPADPDGKIDDTELLAFLDKPLTPFPVK